MGLKNLRLLVALIRARLAEERGAVMVIVAMCLPVFLICVAMTVDLGVLWRAKAQAQTAADAGALAGAGDVVNGTVVAATATADANTFVQANDAAAGATVTTSYNDDPDSVKVVVSKTIPLSFASLFGINQDTVSATAVATSDLTTPLAYFGSDSSDLQDGSATSDGWVNFCAPDGESYSTTNTDDPARCPQSASAVNGSLDGWTLAHGGIDISRSNFYSPPGTTDQMVDLTGTCVEAVGNYPSPHSGTTKITVNGVTTSDDGYCANNADGQIQEQMPTIIGQLYTVNFELGSNTWGYPYEKALMALVSTTDLSTQPPIADTNGTTNASSSSTPYGTTYPLESASGWPSFNGTMLAEHEYFYYGPTGGDTNPNWQAESFTFTATTQTTYLDFGSLVNCAPDWTSSSSLNNSYFYPSSIVGDSPGSVSGSATSTTFVQPPLEVNSDVQSPFQDQCKYGAGISDVDVNGPASVSLTN